MSNTRRNGRLRALVAGAAVVAATMAAPVSPAEAAPGDSDALVFVPYNGQTATVWRNGSIVQPANVSASNAFTGDFSAAQGSDVFLYTPGSAPDGILHVTPSGTTSTTSFTSRNVGGNYQPLVGDFDGNAIDDILWYAPGAAPDALWLFRGNGTHQDVAVNIGGTYRPTVVEVDGDGYDDIIWYGPGAAPDSIWRFGPGGSRTSVPTTIGGDYTLIRGHFQNFAEGSPQDRVIFFAKNGADYIWTFTYGGAHTSKPLSNIDGNYRPIVGTFTDPVLESVLFYAPGATQERFIGFTPGGALQQYEAPQVGGTYDVAVGDYDGNGFDDIAYANGGKATVWRFNGGGYSQTSITTNTVNTLPFTTYRYPQI